MSGNATRPKVLVVEDEFLIRLTLVEALQDEGYAVVEAETGDAALAQAQGVNLLLTDIQLPGGMDGRVLAARMREQAPDLPVIYMTGRPDQAFEMASPLDAFIAKPYTLTDICNAARRMLPQSV